MVMGPIKVSDAGGETFIKGVREECLEVVRNKQLALYEFLGVVQRNPDAEDR
jgi:hypothetical protein